MGTLGSGEVPFDVDDFATAFLRLKGASPSTSTFLGGASEDADIHNVDCTEPRRGVPLPGVVYS
jgi:hypothetical protein